VAVMRSFDENVVAQRQTDVDAALILPFGPGSNNESAIHIPVFHDVPNVNIFRYLDFDL
jgi:hypothetical protein